MHHDAVGIAAATAIHQQAIGTAVELHHGERIVTLTAEQLDLTEQLIGMQHQVVVTSTAVETHAMFGMDGAVHA